MNIGTPFDILSIIYTENIQSDSSVKKDINRSIFSAVSSENIKQSTHFNILPPSSDASGRRLKMDRQSDNIEKGNKNF